MLATLMLPLILEKDNTKAIFLPRRVSFILNNISFRIRVRRVIRTVILYYIILYYIILYYIKKVLRRVILMHFKGLPFQAPFVKLTT